MVSVSDVVDGVQLPATLLLFSNGWYGQKLRQVAGQMDLGLTEEQYIELESVAAVHGVNTRLLLTLARVKNAPDRFTGSGDWLKWIYLETSRIEASLGPFAAAKIQAIQFEDGALAYLPPGEGSDASWALVRILGAGRTLAGTKQYIRGFLKTYEAFFGPPTVDEALPVATTPFLYKPYRVALTGRGYYDHTYPSVDNGGTPNVAGMLDYLGRTNTNYDTHDADDFWMPYGEDVYAPVTGSVLNTGGSGDNQWVLLGYSGNYVIFIGHMSSVSVGSSVSRGQKIGLSGRAGGVDHIHFEVRHNGKQTDTMGWCGGGSDPCPSGPGPTGNYLGCEASVWLWADEDPPPQCTCCGCLPLACCSTLRSLAGTSAAEASWADRFQAEYLGPSLAAWARAAVASLSSSAPDREPAAPAPGATQPPPPAPLGLQSDSHSPTFWSNQPAVHLRWSAAEEGPPAGYTLTWDGSPDTEPPAALDLPGMATEATSPPLATGAWYAHLRALDAGGDASATAHAGPFLVDVTAPDLPANAALQDAGWQGQARPPAFTWGEAEDSGAGLAGYHLYWGADPAGEGDGFVSEATYAPPPLDAGVDVAERTLRVAPLDGAGNRGAWQTVAGWRYDGAPPVATLRVNNGGGTSRSLNVTLHLAAKDEGSGVVAMRFSGDGTSWGEWEPYAPRRGWMLADQPGEQGVYAQVRDGAGNESAVCQAPVTVNLDVPPPSSASYQLARSVVGLGGGSKASAGYRVAGTSGQTTGVARLQSGSYRVLSGFWTSAAPWVVDYRVYLPLVMR
jgi:murein DD-endopeptidase MepM/ murein hydrolase activator NlpD